MLAGLALGLWAAAAPHFALWGHADPAATASLDARQAAISQQMAWNGFLYHHWDIHQLHCGLIRDHWVFKLLATDDMGSVSELVVIVPRSGHDAATLVPIRYGGLSPAGAAEDLHSIAVFNALMSSESGFHAAGAADWIELGELYLNLVGELPQVVGADHLRAAPHAALPHVTPLPGGGAQVEFTDYEGPHEQTRWRFIFDAGGRLRGLRRQP